MWSDVVGRLRDMGSDFIHRVPMLALGLLVLVVTWLVARFLSRTLAKVIGHSRMRPSHIDLVSKLIALSLWVVGLLVAATIVFPGLTPAKLLTVLGVSSVAIGFAFKDVFENFMAGIVILMRNTFEIGNWIECDGHEGRVEKISTRDSHIRQTDGQLVVLPNAQLFKNGLVIRTDKPIRRLTVPCGVAYDASLEDAQAAMETALRSCSTVHQDQPQEVFAHTLGPSSIDFEVTWWTQSDPLAIRQSRGEVVVALKRELDAAEIEIPFPQRTLSFAEPIAMQRS